MQGAEQPEEDFSIVLDILKRYLLQYYEPVKEPKEATLHFTTKEIWEQLLKLFPNELVLRKDLVALWLQEGGFTFHDFGEMRLEWLLKRKN